MTVSQAKQVLQIEAEGILCVQDKISESFTKTVEMIVAAKGRVVIAGIGKSGLVGRKIVATLNSTGTPALFLHPVEAMHGDLGMVSRDDVFLAISNSGNTDELNVLIPSIRAIGCPVVALTGNPDSALARLADAVIDVGVPREACPLGLAPTASTTAQMAVGDALAVCLIDRHHFKSSDFKKFHPGGSLGNLLAARVEDLMITGEAVPRVAPETSFAQTLAEMDRLTLGATLVVESGGRLSGIITDGDIRRFLLKGGKAEKANARDLMTQNPRSVRPDTQASDALNIMEKHLITVLPVKDNDDVVQGILHLHDILGKGSVRFNGKA
ncbi:MAG: KpsF/GutQ family sugar-phosphate isomerase [Thermodesulfobacteriota bacterium]